MPEDLGFATKPQLAADLLARVRAAGLPSRWVAADEVYGGRALRQWIRELGLDYALAVPVGHRVTTPIGRLSTADGDVVTGVVGVDRVPGREVGAGDGGDTVRRGDVAVGGG